MWWFQISKWHQKLWQEVSQTPPLLSTTESKSLWRGLVSKFLCNHGNSIIRMANVTRWSMEAIYVTWSRERSHLSKISISIFLHHFLEASFWCKPHYNWISGFRVVKDLTMLKTIWNKGFGTLFLLISQIQHPRHPRHPTHSSWSCHISANVKLRYWQKGVKKNTKEKRQLKIFITL